MPELLPTPAELAAMTPVKRERVMAHAREQLRKLELEQQRQARIRSLELERIRVTPAQLEAERY